MISHPSTFSYSALQMNRESDLFSKFSVPVVLSQLSSIPHTYFTAVEEPTAMDDGFVPNENHVVCGRGKKVTNHVGNVRFRSVIADYIEQFKAASSKAQKSAVVSSVYYEVTKGEKAFIKQDTNSSNWQLVPESAAREKISQAFRECLQNRSKYVSSGRIKRQLTRDEPKRPPEPTKVMVEKSRSATTSPIFKRQKLNRGSAAPNLSTSACYPKQCSTTRSTDDAFSQLLLFSNSAMSLDTNHQSTDTLLNDAVSFSMALDEHIDPAMAANPFLEQDDLGPMPCFPSSHEALPTIVAQPQYPDIELFSAASFPWEDAGAGDSE